MAFRPGTSYRTAIGIEASFNSGGTEALGALAFTNLAVVPTPLDGTFMGEPLETGYKKGSAIPKLCTVTTGYQRGTLTLTGTLSHDHLKLLQAAMHDTTSPLAWAGSVASPISLVILRIWNDATTSPYTVDKWSGCRVNSLQITGASGGLIQFTATLDAAGYEPRIADQAITGIDPGYTCPAPFKFGDVVYAGNFGSTDTLKSFSITLTPEYADDAATFQNSNTRLTDTVIGWMGELNIVTNHVAANSADYDWEQINTDALDGLAEFISFGDGDNKWEFTSYIQITNMTMPDPDNNLFEANITARIVADTTTGASLSIKIT